MKIIVLHGNDTEKSYNRLTTFINEAKKRGWRTAEFSLEEVSNQTLFDEEGFFILYDYKLLDKKVLEKLKNYSGNLIIYNKGKIPAPSLKVINPDKIELFELPVLLWKFLDHMTIEGLHELVKTNAPEYILAMMAWKFKQNYLKSPNAKSAKLISDLAEIDIKSKTSNVDLLMLLDLFIAKNLK